MPLARYFFFVGGVLVALLLIANVCFPEPPAAADSVAAAADMPVIRIHSDRKWPERVVFDTSVPAVAPVRTAEAGVPVPSTEGSAKVQVRDSFAQLQPPEPRQLQPADLKKPEPKPQRKRRIAKTHMGPPTMLVAQQPRFGFGLFDTAW
jgi:hypothetical protein